MSISLTSTDVAWIDKSVGYTVVGKLPLPELRRIAELVRRQLSGAT